VRGRGEIDGVLETDGNTRLWRFEPEKIVLVTEIRKRDDGRINWTRYVICPSSNEEIFSIGIGYLRQRFDAEHAIQSVRLVNGNSIYYTLDEDEFLAPISCD